MIMKKKNIEKILDRIAYLEIAVNAFRDRLKHLEDYGTKELSIEIDSEALDRTTESIKKTKVKEYKYGDKIVFVSGFYKGSKGTITSMFENAFGNSMYKIILTDGNEIENIEPNEIKLRKK